MTTRPRSVLATIGLCAVPVCVCVTAGMKVVRVWFVDRLIIQLDNVQKFFSFLKRTKKAKEWKGKGILHSQHTPR